MSQSAQSDAELLVRWLPQAQRGGRACVGDYVRLVHRDSRVKERYLALTSACVYLFNRAKLQDPQYMPRLLPLKGVARVLRPVR